MSAGTRARAARQEHEQRELIIELLEAQAVLSGRAVDCLQNVLDNQKTEAARVEELQETTRKMRGTIRKLMEEYHEDLVDVHTRLESMAKRPSLEPIRARSPSPQTQPPRPQTPPHPSESSGDESASPRD